MPTYVLDKTDSDLSGGAHFSKALLDTLTGSQGISISFTSKTTSTSYGFTPTNDPGNSDWQTGSITVEIYVSNGNSKIYLSVSASRVSSSGSVLETSTATSEQQLSSDLTTYTFTVPSKDWTAGNASDRLRINYHFRNSGSGSQFVYINIGTTDNEVTTSINRSPGIRGTIAGTSGLTGFVDFADIKFWRKAGSGGSYAYVGEDDYAVPPWDDSYEFVPATTYYYKAKTSDGIEDSNWSNEVSITYNTCLIGTIAGTSNVWASLVIPSQGVPVYGTCSAVSGLSGAGSKDAWCISTISGQSGVLGQINTIWMQALCTATSTGTAGTLGVTWAIRGITTGQSEFLAEDRAETWPASLVGYKYRRKFKIVHNGARTSGYYNIRVVLWDNWEGNGPTTQKHICVKRLTGRTMRTDFKDIKFVKLDGSEFTDPFMIQISDVNNTLGWCLMWIRPPDLDSGDWSSNTLEGWMYYGNPVDNTHGGDSVTPTVSWISPFDSMFEAKITAISNQEVGQVYLYKGYPYYHVWFEFKVDGTSRHIRAQKVEGDQTITNVYEGTWPTPPFFIHGKMVDDTFTGYVLSDARESTADAIGSGISGIPVTCNEPYGMNWMDFAVNGQDANQHHTSPINPGNNISTWLIQGMSINNAPEIGIQGTISATSSLSGTLTIERCVLYGTITSTSSLSGIEDSQQRIIGTSIGTSSLSGIEDSQQALSTTISGTSVVDGVLTIYSGIIIDGVIPSTSSLSGLLRVDIPLNGICEGVSALSGIEDSQQLLISECSASSTLTGIMCVDIPMGCSIDGSSGVIGTLVVEIPIIGVIEASSTVNAELPAYKAIVGSISASGDIDVALSVYPTKILQAIAVAVQSEWEPVLWVSEIGTQGIVARIDDIGRVMTKTFPYINEEGHIVVGTAPTPIGTGFRVITAMILRHVNHAWVRRGKP